jgi:hypothetical protein
VFGWIFLVAAAFVLIKATHGWALVGPGVLVIVATFRALGRWVENRHPVDPAPTKIEVAAPRVRRDWVAPVVPMRRKR